MARFIIFASGRGSNLISIYNFLQTTNHEFVAMITDKTDCPAANFCREKKIPVITADYETITNREVIEQEIMAELTQWGSIDLVILSGFMRLLTTVFIEHYKGRIINIHPSLLPKYPGTRGIEKSITSEDPMLGVTIHFVDKGMDTGEIILQEHFKRLPSDTYAELEEKIHAIEHRIYPQVVLGLLSQADKKQEAVI